MIFSDPTNTKALFTSVLIPYMRSFCRLEKLIRGCCCHLKRLYQILLSHAHSHSLLAHISYFISISLLGLVALKSLPLKAANNKPTDLDLFFTSVSAATVSSMSTVEMEVFSNSQLVILTILMLIGGEVLTSAISLHFRNGEETPPSKPPQDLVGQLELSELRDHLESGTTTTTTTTVESHSSINPAELRYKSIKMLARTIKDYLLIVHIAGSVSVLVYVCTVADARKILRRKDIRILTFSVFTTVSSFSNCGFIPTNENMMVFKNNSGLLLLIIPQVLLGNTLFPSCLRFCVWLRGKLTKKAEYGYLLNNWKEIGFYHLLPYRHSLLLAFTVLGFIVIQTIAICSMEWHSQALGGMNPYQKSVAAFFMSVNSRHAGESVLDLSTLSQAILVLFVIMMYLPPYTAFMPNKEEKCSKSICAEDKRRPGLIQSLVMSPLSYLAIAIILICITERKKLTKDPLNFNMMNIVTEVISAYGNVGFSSGYSCERQLKPDGNCQDQWYGFVGKWSSPGKIILIVVMFYGRLKKFSLKGGKAWKLL